MSGCSFPLTTSVADAFILRCRFRVALSGKQRYSIPSALVMNYLAGVKQKYCCDVNSTFLRKWSLIYEHMEVHIARIALLALETGVPYEPNLCTNLENVRMLYNCAWDSSSGGLFWWSCTKCFRAPGRFQMHGFQQFQSWTSTVVLLGNFYFKFDISPSAHSGHSTQTLSAA